MKYLVDANVLSELTKPSPNSRVLDWLKVWIRKNRGASHVCPPSQIVRHGNVKHKMGNPVPGAVVQSPLLRHHIGHRARLEGRQFLVLKCFFDTVHDLSSGQPSQCQVGPLQSDW